MFRLRTCLETCFACRACLEICFACKSCLEVCLVCKTYFEVFFACETSLFLAQIISPSLDPVLLRWSIIHLSNEVSIYLPTCLSVCLSSSFCIHHSDHPYFTFRFIMEVRYVEMCFVPVLTTNTYQPRRSVYTRLLFHSLIIALPFIHHKLYSYTINCIHTP
jgi:hypothetical protein